LSPSKNTNAQRRIPRTFFYKLSFANKILVTTLVLLVLLGATGMLVFWGVLRSRLSHEFTSATHLLAREAAVRAGPLLAGGDADALSRLALEVQSLDPTISYVLFADRGGQVVAHTFSWDPPEALQVGDREPAALGEGDFRRVRLEGEEYLDVAAPVLAEAKGVGSIRIGIRADRVHRVVRQINLVFGMLLLALTSIGVLAARTFYRRVTRPIAVLTRLADDVSLGNLHVDFDIGRPVRCWEIKDCDQKDCAAYGDTSVQCWFVDDTPCEGYEPRFPQKLQGCRTCDVYRAHKGDEIVQLADSFRHMTKVLRESRADLERSTRFQRSLVLNSYVGIIATDEFDVVRIFNRVVQNLTGYAEEEVVGRMTWEDLFDPKTIPRWHPAPLPEAAGAAFGFYRREMILFRKTGNPVAVKASGSTVREEGRAIGKVFFVVDLREINTLRENLIRSERLAAIGETVASISHSIKNILDGLRGGAHIYHRGTRDQDVELRDKGWDMVEKNIGHISELVADLLNYARDRQPDLESHDPNLLVTDVVENLTSKAESLGVAIETDLDPAVCPARLDLHTMHQCLTNLVTNAIDAACSREGGRVKVATRSARGDQLEFTVADDGPGVTQDMAETLFSGMASTKGSKGTGLGLLVVHKIVAEHGGTVFLDRESGPGAVFRVRVPRWGKVPAA